MSALLAWAPSCPIRMLFGIPCPGCGMTRAMVLCLEGHFAQAFAMHPMAPIVLAQVLLLTGVAVVVRGPDRRLRRHALTQAIGFVDLLAALAVWGFRLYVGELA